MSSEFKPGDRVYRISQAAHDREPEIYVVEDVSRRFLLSSSAGKDYYDTRIKLFGVPGYDDSELFFRIDPKSEDPLFPPVNPKEP